MTHPKTTQWIAVMVYIYSHPNLPIIRETGNGLSFQILCGEHGLSNAPDPTNVGPNG